MVSNQTLRRVLSCAAAALAAPAAAQDQGTFLGEVVLSGGFAEIAAQGYGRAYAIVTGQDLADRGVTTVQDALRGLPGISVTSTGNSLTAVRIRGGEADNVLILIDGVEARGGDQSYDLSGLETTNIERIEVLRGPQSVYYGSNAAAGVVNIITRKAAEGTEASLSLEAGNGVAGSGFVSTRTARGGLAFSASVRDDRGYDQSGDRGGDADGILRRTLGLSGDWQATDDLTLSFTLRRSVEDYGFDANADFAATADEYVIDSDATGERDETVAAVFADLSTLDGRLTHRLSLQESRYKDAFDGGDFTTATTTAVKYRGIWGLDGTVAEATQTISLAIDRTRDRNDAAGANERNSTSYALEYRGRYANGLAVQGGLRHDANDVFADATTWSLGLSYDLPDRGVRLHASGGTGIVNPTYLELVGGFGFDGNPGLQPETTEGFDIGAEFALPDGRGTIDVTYFNERLTNEIVFAPSPVGPDWQNQPGTSPRQGVEVAGTWEATDDLSLRLAYTYTDARSPNGRIEVRRPRHELVLGASLRAFGGRGTVSGDIRHVADNFDTQFFGDFAVAKLPDYTLVNVAATYDLNDRVRLTGRVSNLFDQDYTEVWGYATPGRTAWLGVDARW